MMIDEGIKPIRWELHRIFIEKKGFMNIDGMSVSIILIYEMCHAFCSHSETKIMYCWNCAGHTHSCTDK